MEMGVIADVCISAGGMFEVFGAMYIQSFTFRDVILVFVPYCQSNCKLSSLVAKSCEWNIVIG